MNKFFLLSEKSRHLDLFRCLKTDLNNSEWTLINRQDDFNLKKVELLNPDRIFIPHWSYIIPKEIYERFECVVFHMTDLPYGRGGSPLQNLIVRGHKNTMISALKVVEGIDAGPIYLKKALSFVESDSILHSILLLFIFNENCPSSPKQFNPFKNFLILIKFNLHSSIAIGNFNLAYNMNVLS
jgi:methionyl-tRNA formyltransferase